jgi:zinc transport system ATP-binding protein
MKTPRTSAPLTKTPLISLRNVSAGYDGKKVLSGVSLNIYDSDFLGITGPNGGGKTTLVKVILGLLPHSGTVEYADSLTAGGIRRIGYLPQQNVFDRSFPISVIDVVVSGLQTEKGFTRRYTREDFMRARNILKVTEISHLEHSPVGEISGGQMQRAMLCRALIAEPHLLILDEPDTFVDSRFESELHGLLRKLNEEQGTAIVMVSHDTAAIAGLAGGIVTVDGTFLSRRDTHMIAATAL